MPQRTAARGKPEQAGRQSCTLRPRLATGAAAIAFLEAAERRGFLPPEGLERRHRAGLERLLREMAGEYLDDRRMDDLLAILAAER